MDSCPNCNTFLELCPCCGVSFCPDCRATEDQLEKEE